MRVLVIGGSGHLGNAIARAFLDAQSEVTIAGRRAIPPANLRGLPVRYVSGDSDAHGQFDSWIAGHDIVVDAAAPYPLGVFSLAAKDGEPAIVRAERRTRRLLDAISKHGARLGYVSTYVTLARPRAQEHQLQMQMMRLTHSYFEVKELIESRILDAARHGICAVVINPTYCLGPWDVRDPQLCAIPMLLRGQAPISTNQMLKIVDVRDMAAALVAAFKAERYGEPLLLSAHKVSNRDLFAKICEIGRVPPPRTTIAPILALASTLFAEALMSAMGPESPALSGLIMMAAAFDYLPSHDALQELSITPRSLTQTITDAIQWYREIGYC